MKNPPPLLQRDLAHAPDYATWREIALEMDHRDGNDIWRAEDACEGYDHWLIKERLLEVRRMRREQDVRRLVFRLHEGLHGNLGNMANPLLYGHCRVGTKRLITEYVEEVAKALLWICDTEFDDFGFEEKILFFKRTGVSFGRSALMLSGGATLGMFHFGVIKALHEQGLLPRVISGSSAGSIVAGGVSTRTDDEIAASYSLDTLNLDAWQKLDFRTAVQGRAIMNPDVLAQCLLSNIGESTFEEAFERTGRILDITVSPAERHQHGRLLNYLTSPNVLIYKASQASCSVPGLFPPVTLKAREYDGDVIDYMPSKRWVDGSLSSDLPMLRLARLHNVNHYIVSQTNPHVVPFLAKDDATGLLPFARDWLMGSGKQTIDLARLHFRNRGVGRVVRQIHALTNQRYTGDVTILPRYTPKKMIRALANPTVDEMRCYVEDGERATWPTIERVRIQTTISRTFEECLIRLKAQRFGRRRDDAPMRVARK